MWFWIRNLHKNIQLMLKFLIGPVLVLHFSYYTLMTFLLMLSADDITLYSTCDQTSDLWQHLELVSELESDLHDTVDWSRKWFVDFNNGKTQLVLFEWSNNTGAIDKKMEGFSWGFSWANLSFKMLGLTFSSKLDYGCYIISIAKTAYKKIGALICSAKFLSPERNLFLYLNKGRSFCTSINLQYDHVWDTAVMSGLVLLVYHLQDCWSITCCLSWTLGSSSKCSQLNKSFL